MATNYALRVNATTGSAGQITVSGTATATASAINLSAVRYWMVSDVDCFIRFGTTASFTAPTTANSIWMPAGIPHVIDVPRGGTATNGAAGVSTFAKVLRKGGSSGKLAYLPVA